MGSTSFALPEIKDIVLNADNVFQDSDRGTIELSGQVQIVFNNQHLSAQRATVYSKGKMIEAYGNVTIVTPTAHISTKRVTISYKTNLGTMYDGFVKSGGVVFAGEIIHKVGENDYEVTQGSYTACDTCPAPWNFTGSHIKARIGEYAYISYPILRIAGLPILPLPYIIIPLKSARQSGLLFPSFGFSGRGFTFSQSFFWAMNRSQDTTWTFNNHPRRKRYLFEYRYLLSENSRGKLNYTYVDAPHLGRDDYRFSKYQPDGKPQGVKRWHFKYENHFEFSNNSIYRVNLDLPSDLQYSKDFAEETLTNGYSALDNRMSFTKNTDTQHLSIDASYYINLLQANPYGDNKDAVHRLPEVTYSLAEQKIFNLPLLFRLDMNYTNFYRPDSNYDDITELDGDNRSARTSKITRRFPTNNAKKDGLTCDDFSPDCHNIRDGKFDPQDLIRTGQRINISPSVIYPLHLGRYFDFVPSLTFRQTRYNFGFSEQSNYHRSHLRATLSTKTTLSKSYGMGNTKRPIYKHEIQPEIIATTIPWIEDEGHPFFNIEGKQAETPFFRANESISNQDLFSNRRLQFDYFDRLYDRELVTFAINNKLTRKTWTPDGADYKQIAKLQLSQTYDSFEARRNNKQPWSTINTLLEVHLKFFETITKLSYYPYHSVANFDSRLRFSVNTSDYLELLINRKFQIGEETTIPYDTRVEDYTLSFFKSWQYLDFAANMIYNQVTAELKSWKSIALVKFPGNCWAVSFSLADSRDQADPTDFNISFEFKFNGDKKSSLY